MNTRPPLTTNAPPLLLGEPNRSGNVTPFSNGLSRMYRLPSPSGTFQAISPLFRSMAVRTAHGGDTSGNPPAALTAFPTCREHI